MFSKKDKIRALFYSSQESNRKLAFELAKGAQCYEEMVEEFYTALQELPPFEGDKAYWLELMQDIYEEEQLPWPTATLELKRMQVEGFCIAYFREEMNLKGNLNRDAKKHSLQEFPKVLLKCTFIRTLDLSWNALKLLPLEIEQLTNLVKLDLSCNDQLRNLPETLAKLPQLEELNLYGISGLLEATPYEEQDPRREQYNYLLPDFFQEMKSLKALDLGDVYIKELPEWIHKMSNLESLLLFSGSGSNPALKLPKSLTQVAHLELLQINAYTTAIPEDIDKIQSLECLIVEPALTIPSSIKNLKNLHYLDLSYFSYDLTFDQVEGYQDLFDLSDKGVPEGLSRIKIYGWEWIKEMTQLKEFVFKHVPPYAFTTLERRELEEALPNCKFVFED